MKRLKVGDNVILNKSSYWVRIQVMDGYWCSLEGFLTITRYCPLTDRVEFGDNCLWLEATCFAVINNEEA
tara:strand:+ start:167 stop:376 length:210 start_codon:yes stop_codon:yes gene_type:complete